MMKRPFGIMVFVLLLCVPHAFAIPTVVDFQGKLLNSGNQPQTGVFNMTFTLYNQSASGNMIWRENRLVSVSNGLFSVLLGSNVPLNTTFSEDYYLEVNASGELFSPRYRLASVPYALRANISEMALARTASTTSFIVRAIASQTSNLTEWQNSGGQTLAAVDVLGRFIGDGSLLTGIGTSATTKILPAANVTNGTFGSAYGDNGSYAFAKNLTVFMNFSVGSGTFFVNQLTGRIGVGISNPIQTLHVIGSINITNITLAQNCVDGEVLKWAGGVGVCGTDGGGTANATASGGTGWIPKFVNDVHLVSSVIFTDNTSIGIGTTSPSAKLTVNGTLSSGLSLNVSGILYVNTSSSRVGIGTTSPLGRLNIHTPSGTSSQLWITTDTNLGSANEASIVFESDRDGTVNDAIIGQFSDGSLRISGASNIVNPDVVIDDNGMVGVMAITPVARLHVNGTNPANNLSFNVNNTLYVNASSNNVGIGTASPGDKLEISAAGAGIRFSDPSLNQFYQLRRETQFSFYGNTIGLQHWVPAAANLSAFVVYGGSANTMDLWVFDGMIQFGGTVTGGGDTNLYRSAADTLKTDDTLLVVGSVGINTTTPSARLDIQGANTANNLSLNVNNTLFVNASTDRVGIGTSNPNAHLHVIGNLNVTGESYLNNLNIAGVTLANGEVNASTDLNVVRNVRIGRNLTVSNNLLFVNNETGQIGIGTTTPASVARLDVNGSAVFASGISGVANVVGVNVQSPQAVLDLAFPNAGSGQPRMLFGRSSAGDADIDIKFFRNGGGANYMPAAIQVGGLQGNDIRFKNGPVTTTIDETVPLNTIVTFAYTGSVGIGTTNPQAKLHINGTHFDYLTGTSNNLSLNVNNTLYVNGSTNRVGIGTANPNNELQVIGRTNTTNLTIHNLSSIANCDVKADSTGTVYCGTDSTGGGGNASASGATGYIPKFHNDTHIIPSVIFTDNTSIGIGTTTPNAKLGVIGTDTSNNLSLNVNNTLFVNGSSGFVGLGTANPLAALYVATGNINAVNAVNPQVGVTDTTNVVTTYILSTDNYGLLGTNTNHPVQLVTGGSNVRLFLDNTTGDVGVNTVTPRARLHVVGADTLINNLSLNVNNTLYVNGSTDRVGIGISNASETLDVRGSVYVSTGIGIGASPPSDGLRVRDSGNVYYGTSGARIGNSGSSLFIDNNDGSGNLVYQLAGGNHQFQVTANNNSLVIVGSSGNVGINTANPNQQLVVNGTLNITNVTLANNCADDQVLKWSNGVGICGTDSLGSGSAAGWTTTAYNVYNNSPGINIGIGTATTDAKLTVTGVNLSNNLSLNVNNTLYVNASTSYVGVGTTNPGTRLHVRGGSGGSLANSDPGVFIDEDSSGTARIEIRNDPAGFKAPYIDFATTLSQDIGGRIQYGYPSAEGFNFLTNNSGTPKVVIDANGKVGINTTSPGALLEVSTTAANHFKLTATGSDPAGIWLSTNNITRWGNWTAGGGIAINVSSGNVGIGTVAPFQKLVVIGTVNVSNIILAQNCADGQVLKWAGGVGICGTDSTAAGAPANITGSGATGYIPKFTNDTHIVPSVIFTDNTSIGIGTTTTSARLTVAGASLSSNLSLNINNTLYVNGSTDRVGIRTSSPSDTLQVSGSANIGTTGSLRIATVDTDTVNLRPGVANGDIWITDDSASSSRGLVIANAGRVGIGTANPGGLLTINGPNSGNNQLQITSNLSQGPFTFVILNETGGEVIGISPGGGITHRGRAGDGDFSIMQGGMFSLVFGTNGTERMRISPWNGGRVGIGEVDPNQKLVVNGTINATNIMLYNNCADGQVLKWSSGVGTCGTDSTGASAVAGWTTTTNPYVYNDTTNIRVGIGTATPESTLHVVTTNLTATNPIALKLARMNLSGNGVNGTGMILQFDVENDAGAMFRTGYIQSVLNDAQSGGEDSSMHFVTASNGLGDIAMSITGTSRNVGIGTSAPAARLHVSGTNILNNLSLNVNNTLYVNASQNRVGIGISNPDALLVVEKNQNAVTQLILRNIDSGSGARAEYVSTSDAGTVFFGIAPLAATGIAYIINTGNTGFAISTNNTGALTIDASQRFGLNFGSPLQRLVVNGTLNATNIILANNCADDQILKWSGGVGTCGTDSSGGGGAAGWTTTADPYVYNDTANVRVGIGTSTPTVTLDVRGSIFSNSTVYINATNALQIMTANTTHNSINLLTQTNGTLGLGSSGTKGWHLTARGSNHSTLPTQRNDLLLFYAEDTTFNERVYFKNNGNVGIGASDPAQRLQVGGNISLVSDGFITSASDFTNYFKPYEQGTGRMVFRTNGLDRISVLYSNGNVGINNTNPSVKLEVNVNSTTRSLDGMRLTDGTRSLRFMPGTVGAGSFNQLTRENDTALIFSNNTLGGGGLVIAPWLSGSPGGMRMDGEGNVNFTDNVYYGGNLTGYGADIAEYVNGLGVEAGDVVIISPSADRTVEKTNVPYDTRAAGIVSTAPSHRIAAGEGNTILALAGRVPVKVINENGGIKRGDLLTTSGTPGHAMKCSDRSKCAGAIIGKAMENFDAKKGVIVTLIVLG